MREPFWDHFGIILGPFENQPKKGPGSPGPPGGTIWWQRSLGKIIFVLFCFDTRRDEEKETQHIKCCGKLLQTYHKHYLKHAPNNVTNNDLRNEPKTNRNRRTVATGTEPAEPARQRTKPSRTEPNHRLPGHMAAGLLSFVPRYMVQAHRAEKRGLMVRSDVV